MTAPLISALDDIEEIMTQADGRDVMVFLDYDGTLTPIVDRPDLAVMADDVRTTVRNLARVCRVAVISGRALDDVRHLVGLDEIYYAGSHGFEISGPGGFTRDHEAWAGYIPKVRDMTAELKGRLDQIQGALVEEKRFTVAVHYRLVKAADQAAVDAIVDDVLGRHPSFRKAHGKKVYELRPDIAWDKGKAVEWLIEVLAPGNGHVFPIYIGDDVTDEDAFVALRDRGIGIAVQSRPAETAARFVLRDPNDVAQFLHGLEQRLGGLET
jgi:trehalose-phosphatase